MTSKSGSQQPTDTDVGPVLCDTCQNPVLKPDQTASNLTFDQRWTRFTDAWHLSPSMWPVGYLISSSYSPLRVEQQHPGRQWRDAFEDLLALESRGEMIDPESRKEENEAFRNFIWGNTSALIDSTNKANREISTYISWAQHKDRPEANRKTLNEKIQRLKEIAQKRHSFAQAARAKTEAYKNWSASKHKPRGHWISSLITTGALTGWSTSFQDSAHGVVVDFRHEDDTNPAGSDGIVISELELLEVFEQGKPLFVGSPPPPLYKIPFPSAHAKDEFEREHLCDGIHKPPTKKPMLRSPDPDRPYFSYQTTHVERVTLPNGKKGTKVTLKNVLTNGEIEEQVIVQNPGKVLLEVFKAREAVADRMRSFLSPNEASRNG